MLCVDELIYEHEFVSPIHGAIIIPNMKRNCVFETSPLPQNYTELYMFVFDKISELNIKEFEIKIFVGRMYVEVRDDTSYTLVWKWLHYEAGKNTALCELKLRVMPLNCDDRVSFLCLVAKLFVDFSCVNINSKEKNGRTQPQIHQ